MIPDRATLATRLIRDLACGRVGGGPVTTPRNTPAAPPSAALGGPVAPLGSWTAYALSPARTAPHRPEPYLSAVERQIVAALARGTQLGVAARSCGVVPQTAGVRLTQLRQRYGIQQHTQAAVVAWACRAGLLDDVDLGSRRDVQVTRQRRAVLALLAEGLTNAQIGKRLWITEDTVKTHLRETFPQIGAVSRAHAVALDWRYRYSAEPVAVAVAAERRRR